MPPRRRKKPLDPTPLALLFSCHLCSNCPACSGLHLPCSGLGCLSLGSCSSIPWRVLSLDRSSSVIRSKGPRSATVKSIPSGRLFGSVSIASYYWFFCCKTQVCYCLPILFYIVLMDYIRALILHTLRNILSGSSDWNGLLSFTWLWCCLSLGWLFGVEVTIGVKFWFYGWLLGDTQPHRLMYRDLVRCVYSLVFTQFRHSRIAGLLLNFFKIATLTSNCFTDWAHTCLSRLYYLYCMIPTILFNWLTRTMCSLLLAPHIGLPKRHGTRVLVSHPLAITLRSWDPVFCKVPPSSLVSLQLHMSGSFPHRTRITMSLMRFVTEQSVPRFDNSVSWASPSLLLSLLVILYAQNHDSKCYCFCWHLFHFQNVWDEVKGLYPLVYEDSFYEERPYSLMGCGLCRVFSFIFFHCPLPFFQPDWVVKQGQWVFIYVYILAKRWISAFVVFSSVLIILVWSVATSTRSFLSCILLRPEV